MMILGALKRMRVYCEIWYLRRLRDRLCGAINVALRLASHDGAIQHNDTEQEEYFKLAVYRVALPYVFRSEESQDAPWQDYKERYSEWYKKLLADYEARREDIDSLILEARESVPEIKRFATNYFVIQSRVFAQNGDERKSRWCLVEAQTWNPDARPVGLLKAIRTEMRDRKKFLRLRDQLARRTSLKVDEILRPLVPWISISAVFFVFSGYASQAIVLGSFGIDYAPYFEVGDYVASSFDTLMWAGVAGVVACVAGALGMSDATELTDRERGARVTEGRMVKIGLLLVVLLTVLLQSNINPNEVTMLAIVVVLILGAPVIVNLSVRKFKSPPAAFVGITFVLVFCVSVITSSGATAYHLHNEEWGELDRVGLYYIESSADDDVRYGVVVSGTSSVLFVMDRRRGVHVIQREAVQRISGM